MTFLLRLSRACVWFGVAAITLVMLSAEVASGRDAKSPPAKQVSDDPTSPYYSPPSDKPKGGPERDKQVATIKETLAALIPKPRDKKADDDLFVIGTIDIQNHKVNVDFPIKKGLLETAEFIADFLLGKKPGVVREWKAFGRAKTQKVAEVIQTKAKAESIEGQLAAFPLSARGKKTPDDFFVVGTAEVNLKTKNADVRFEVLGGIKSTSDFLVDYIFNRPKDLKGEWHVFYRFNTDAQASASRQQMRDTYDQMEAERTRIAAIYNAATTHRC